MSVYSFKDVVAAIVGPGGAFPLANGAGAAEEGIKVEPVADKNTMTIGAGGDGMHSLSADESSTVTVSLLKTSPINAALQAMYNLQSASSLTWGKNTITITDIARGDIITLTGVAFKKRAPVGYNAKGDMMEWSFDAIRTDQVLGVGTPEL